MAKSSSINHTWFEYSHTKHFSVSEIIKANVNQCLCQTQVWMSECTVLFKHYKTQLDLDCIVWLSSLPNHWTTEWNFFFPWLLYYKNTGMHSMYYMQHKTVYSFSYFCFLLHQCQKRKENRDIIKIRAVKWFKKKIKLITSSMIN